MDAGSYSTPYGAGKRSGHVEPTIPAIISGLGKLLWGIQRVALHTMHLAPVVIELPMDQRQISIVSRLIRAVDCVDGPTVVSGLCRVPSASGTLASTVELFSPYRSALDAA